RSFLPYQDRHVSRADPFSAVACFSSFPFAFAFFFALAVVAVSLIFIRTANITPEPTFANEFSQHSMNLRRVSLINYRNYESAEVEFSPRINVLVGANGSGKTNLLDAVYYLSFTRSSRQPLDSLNVRHGQDHFSIRGDFEIRDRRDTVTVVLQPGAR